MKQIDTYISEKLKLDKNIKVNVYKYFPASRPELSEILEERLAKDKDADLNDIDVSQVTDMSYLFGGLDPHNIKIDKWDVSNVKFMYSMFNGCENFNSDLSNWDVSNVKLMDHMFKGCKKFNSDLNNWRVSNVKDMYGMFFDCDSLKNIPNWYD